MEFQLERRPGSAPVVHLTFTPIESSTTVSDALALAENAGENAEIWMHGTTPERRSLVEATGRVSNRTLLKMVSDLPVTKADGTLASSGIETVAFTNDDVDEFMAVNNRAFSWHPEQSGLTADQVRNDMAEPWFDADGFRMHWIDGQLAGFCWTKIHESDDLHQVSSGADPRVGEIYVIAVDPPFHGQGLGKAMTLAGLEHITSRGIPIAILYVESDNAAAVATYERLGFTVGREDTLWSPIQKSAP